MRTSIRLFPLTLMVTLTVGAIAFGSAAIEARAATTPARPKKVQAVAPELNDAQRNSLRYKLENIWNEVDLLVRNANSDQLDLQRQERELKLFQVYQKIPIAQGENSKPEAMAAALKKSASGFGLQVQKHRVIQASKADRPIPAAVFTDENRFRFSEDQLVEKLRMELVVSGSHDQLQAWMSSWGEIADPSHAAESGVNPDSLSPRAPLIEWDPKAENTIPEPLKNNHWKIQIQAYRFRDVKFPKLNPRDPMDVIPPWAKKNPELFKAREPLLWGFVEKTKALLPQAAPKYEARGQFLLNSARMTFFMSKLRSG